MTSILLTSCSDYFEQSYDTYDEYNSRNLRNKSWFPAIISTDAYNLRSKSYLEELCAFGSYNYSANKYYDSAFVNGKAIDFSLFAEKVKINERHKPNWFLDLSEIPKNNIQTIQKERFYIARDTVQKKIYFVITN